MERAVGKVLRHGVVVRHGEGDVLDGGLDQVHRVLFAVFIQAVHLVDAGTGAGIVAQRAPARARELLDVELEVVRQGIVHPGALIVIVDLKVRGHVVVVQQLVRAARDRGMAVVAGLRVEDRLFQQLGRVEPFLHGQVLVADVDAVAVAVAQVGQAVGIDLAARRDDGDRIGHAQQKARLKEVGQELVIQRDRQLVFVYDAHALQIGHLARDVFVVAQYVLGAVDLAADLLDLGRHHQQQAEGVVPGRDGRAVAVVQIVVERQKVRSVAHFVFHHQHVLHDGFVDQVHALVLIPVDKVIAVQQRAHVDVRRVVAEHLGKKVALGDRGMPHAQLVGKLNEVALFVVDQFLTGLLVVDDELVPYRDLRGLRGLLCPDCETQRTQKQHQRQQKGQVLLHTVLKHDTLSPFFAPRPPRPCGEDRGLPVF